MVSCMRLIFFESADKTVNRKLLISIISCFFGTFSNLLIELLKLTAVASLITISDLTYMAQIIRVQTALTLEPFLLILVIYFILASILVQITNFIEKKFSKGRNIMIAGDK